MMKLKGQITPVVQLKGKLSKPVGGKTQPFDNTIETVVELIDTEIIDSALVNNSSVNAVSGILNNSIVVVYSAEGGIQPYQYACDYKPLSDSLFDSEWITAFDYNSQTSNEIEVSNAGYYMVNAKIKDSANQESFKTFVIEIENEIPIS